RRVLFRSDVFCSVDEAEGASPDELMYLIGAERRPYQRRGVHSSLLQRTCVRRHTLEDAGHCGFVQGRPSACGMPPPRAPQRSPNKRNDVFCVWRKLSSDTTSSVLVPLTSAGPYDSPSKLSSRSSAGDRRGARVDRSRSSVLRGTTAVRSTLKVGMRV